MPILVQLSGKDGTPVNEINLTLFRQQLEEFAGRVHGDVNAVTEQARGASGGQAGGELSNAPSHLGDRGSEEYIQELHATLLETETYLAVEAREALQRMEAGSYGICQLCQQAIPVERLEAIPYARCCVQCAAIPGMASE